jgi:hypothetical protein
MSVFMQPIYTQTVGAGGAASVTFNNIPQGFTDLMVVISARMNTSGGAYVGILPNNNTNPIGSYTYIGIAPSSGTVYTGRSINLPYGFFVYTVSNANTANTFSNNEFYIPNYSGGQFKTCISNSVAEDNAVAGNASISPTSFIMNTTDPITSIVVKDTVSGFSLMENSTITIYGISERYDTAIPLAPTIGTVTDQAGFASVAFTANDTGAGQTADRYVVTSTPSGSTTVGQTSPIVTPAALGTSYTYQVAAVNALGSSSSSASAALTTVNNYNSIATGTLSSATSFFDFTNIPQNYKHLQLRLRVRGAASNPIDYFLFQIQPWTSNSDYYTHAMEAVNDTNVRGSIYSPTNTFSVNLMSSGSQNANNFTALVVDFYDYSNTNKFKTAQLFGGFSADNTTSGQNNGNITISGGILPQLAPITNIRVAAYTNLTVGSTFSLYGVS